MKTKNLFGIHRYNPFGGFLLSLTNSANEVLPRHRRFTNGNFYFFGLLKKYEEEA